MAHLSSSLYQNQFVTKTCLTTYTYLTTYLENGSTTISSHEQVVSNIATEERNYAKITATPTASSGFTLTQVLVKIILCNHNPLINFSLFVEFKSSNGSISYNLYIFVHNNG